MKGAEFVFDSDSVSDISLSPSSGTPAKLRAEFEKLKVEFLDYIATIERLDDILKRLKSRTSYEAAVLRIVLSAQRAVLGRLNDEHLSCKVGWDRRTGLPSHPSLIADIQKYVDLFKPSRIEKMLLRSFGGWAVLGHQTMDCACGRGFKTRTVAMDFMVNTMLRVENNTLLMKQLVGIRTDDPAHLSHHYDYGKASKRVDDCSIVFESEGKITNKNSLSVRHLSQKSAGQFNADKFVKLVSNSIS